MRISLFYKIIAPVILIIYAITSCNYFSMPEAQYTIHTVPVGLGDVGAVFLDNNYKPTTEDVGKLALYVENNDLAKDVMVIAEILDDHIDNNVVVRVINGQNNSLVSFFYHSGQYFPYKMVITINGEDIEAGFSMYNWLKQTYSVEFFDDAGESETYNNLVLNKNIFYFHEYSDTLTETQNERLQKIYTTLALWTSMAVHLENMDDNDPLQSARKIKINLKKVIVGALVVVAVVAFTAAVICSGGAAIAVAGPLIAVELAGTAAVLGAVSVVAAAGAFICDKLLPDDMIIEIGCKPSPPAPFKHPKVEIKLNGDIVKNNQIPSFYLECGESITFNISVTDFGEPVQRVEDIIDINRFIIPYSSHLGKEIGFDAYNAAHFTVDKFEINKMEITLNREEDASGTGIHDGKVQYVLKFKKDVIINGISTGISFKLEPDTSEKIRKDIYVLNFTVRPEP
ncbi:MAG: hypothetical protein LBU88_08500 [Treponema sp.]|jgi:hypothetical protein|nr:hypothetical protein [Treponema sp.]